MKDFPTYVAIDQSNTVIAELTKLPNVPAVGTVSGGTMKTHLRVLPLSFLTAPMMFLVIVIL